MSPSSHWNRIPKLPDASVIPTTSRARSPYAQEDGPQPALKPLKSLSPCVIVPPASSVDSKVACVDGTATASPTVATKPMTNWFFILGPPLESYVGLAASKTIPEANILPCCT